MGAKGKKKTVCFLKERVFEAMINVPQIGLKDASKIDDVFSVEKACRALIIFLMLRNGWIVFDSIVKLFKICCERQNQQKKKEDEDKKASKTPIQTPSDPNSIIAASNQIDLKFNGSETVILVSPINSSGESNFDNRGPSNVSDTQFSL